MFSKTQNSRKLRLRLRLRLRLDLRPLVKLDPDLYVDLSITYVVLHALII